MAILCSSISTDPFLQPGVNGAQHLLVGQTFLSLFFFLFFFGEIRNSSSTFGNSSTDSKDLTYEHKSSKVIMIYVEHRDEALTWLSVKIYFCAIVGGKVPLFF